MRNVQCILLPTDFSPSSDAAFQVACDLAAASNARIVLLHVHHAPIGIAGTVPIAVPSASDESTEAEQLRQIEAPNPQLNIERQMKSGDPGQVILSVAEECQADLIVLGTHGRTGLTHAAMGGIAARVSLSAKCGVIMVKLPPSEAAS